MTALVNAAPEPALCLEYVADAGGCVRLPHDGDSYELIVVERGSAFVEAEGQPGCLGAGDAALVAPRRVCRVVSSVACALWIARFDPGEVDVALPFASVPVHRLAAERRQAVFAVLRLLAQSGRDPSADRRLVRRLHFAAVVASVLESAAVREFAAAPPSTLVRDALRIVDRRYAESIGPAEIARALRRHPAYLTNLVREATGKSLGTWLIERRLAAARVLLRTTDDAVGEIAAAVGYVDVSHFARFFTRRYGTPPARWRRRHST